MNKRIKQLAEQCRIETYGVNGELLAFGFDEEKFAELIVQECAQVAWQHTPDTEELEYSHLIKDKILANFGVEE
jgi:hypothetical protein